MKNDYFIKENLLTENAKIISSPSCKYLLNINVYKTKEGCWNYSRGEAFSSNGSLKAIADVKRNYPSFPFKFVENHPNGHDYLLCGENYQGQTVIELDTGKRSDYIPRIAKKGAAFCMVGYDPNPNKTHILVNGCVWGGPYEYILYDFSDPLNLPWPYITSADPCLNDEGDQIDITWNENGTIVNNIKCLRILDGKNIYNFSEDEQEQAILNKWQGIERYNEVIKINIDGSVNILSSKKTK